VEMAEDLKRFLPVRADPCPPEVEPEPPCAAGTAPRGLLAAGGVFLVLLIALGILGLNYYGNLQQGGRPEYAATVNGSVAKILGMSMGRVDPGEREFTGGLTQILEEESAQEGLREALRDLEGGRIRLEARRVLPHGEAHELLGSDAERLAMVERALAAMETSCRPWR